MVLERFIGTTYSFEAGPRELFGVPESEIKETNCQFAALLYYQKAHGLTLQPEEALSSSVYASTGLAVAEEIRDRFQDYATLAEVLKPGQLLCTLNKKDFPYEPPFSQLDRDEELQKTLHLASFIGDKDSEVMRTQFPTFRDRLSSSVEDLHIFHACRKKGKKVNVWTLKDMLDNYWVMRIKDVVSAYPNVIK